VEERAVVNAALDASLRQLSGPKVALAIT